jgi:hypothetical protein
MLTAYLDFSQQYGVTSGGTLGGAGAGWASVAGTVGANEWSEYVAGIVLGDAYSSPGGLSEQYLSIAGASALTTCPGDSGAVDADVACELDYRMQASGWTGTPRPVQVAHHFGGVSATAFDRDGATPTAGITSLILKATPSGSTHTLQATVCSDTTRVTFDMGLGGTLANATRYLARIEIVGTDARFWLNGTVIGTASVGARKPRSPFLVNRKYWPAYSGGSGGAVQLWRISGEYFPVTLGTLLWDKFDGSAAASTQGRAPDISAMGVWSNTPDANNLAQVSGNGTLLLAHALARTGTTYNAGVVGDLGEPKWGGFAATPRMSINT